MAAAQPGKRYNGWWLEPGGGRLSARFNGTEVFDFDINDLAVAVATVFASTVQTGALTMASGTSTGNFTLSNTLTAGADGVGADGEQLTSGGAAAECDWAAAGSLREFKKILGIRDDADQVLEDLVATPVYDFQYRSKDEYEGDLDHPMTTGDRETKYTGIMADEAPWAMHFKGRILNPINTFGYTLLAIKGLYNRIGQLEAQLAQQGT